MVDLVEKDPPPDPPPHLAGGGREVQGLDELRRLVSEDPELAHEALQDKFLVQVSVRVVYPSADGRFPGGEAQAGST
jgi:hypothetical protein